MDDFDIFSSNSTTQPNDVVELKNTDFTAKTDETEDSSWIIANTPQPNLVVGETINDTNTSTKPLLTNQFDLFGGDSLSDMVTSSPSNLFAGDIPDDATIKTKPDQFDLFGGDAATPPATVLQSNFIPTPIVTEQNDIFSGDNASFSPHEPKTIDSSSNAMVVPAPVHYEIFDQPTSASHSDADVLGNTSPQSTTDSSLEDPINEDEPLHNMLSMDSTKHATEEQPSWNSYSDETLSPMQLITQQRERELAVKDAEEARRKDELRQQAKTDLDRWYNQRQRQMEQKRETMKTDEETLRTKSLEKSSKESCDWAKVVRFLDFSPGTQITKSKRDLTRMKSCIISAKHLNASKNVANGV